MRYKKIIVGCVTATINYQNIAKKIKIAVTHQFVEIKNKLFELKLNCRVNDGYN